jgi:hypothetical protein
MRRRVALAAVVACALSLLVPAAGAAGEQAPFRTAIALTAGHDASAIVRLPLSGVWRPTFRRPASQPLIMELVPLARPDYSYAAIVLPTGDIVVNVFDGDGGGGGFFGTRLGGEPPRWVNGWARRLPAGRYRVTLLTTEPTSVHLELRGSRQPVQRVRATHKTAAHVSTASLENPTAADVAHQSLAFDVPVGAHQVLLFSSASWTGEGAVDYQSACDTGLPAAGPPCEPDPGGLLFSARPTLDEGQWSSWLIAAGQPVTTGKDTASYEMAVTGTVSTRTILAVALP